MLNLPLSFRVTAMHADEGGHFITLREVRAPFAVERNANPGLAPHLAGTYAGGPQVATPETPSADICLRVTPDQFASARVGGMYDVAPAGLGVAQGLDRGALERQVRELAR